MNIQRTPLYETHQSLGARLVDFAGWEMPVEYKGLRLEHEAVRAAVGLFDVSHMGEIFVRGPNALKTLEMVTSNQVSRLENGQAQYTLLMNDHGGIVDDLIIYCIEKNENYLVCANASNVEKDFLWLQKHNQGADLKNESTEWGQIAIQGPHAIDLVERIFPQVLSQMKPFEIRSVTFLGEACWIASTGYTGEKGCEIFVPAKKTVKLWEELMQKGNHLGVQPIGLGARDTLRTEMKYSLYGHEISDETNPFEAGLGWVVKWKDKEFLGKSHCIAAREKGLKRKLIGFKLLEKGIPRQGYKLFSFDSKEIGEVTSGTLSPTLNEAIGIGYVSTELSDVGSEFLVEIRSRKVKAIVVQTPFVKSGVK